MSSLVIVGAQWGDEGKGKLVDYFTSAADWSVRFNGGNNAGHTIVCGDTKVKLSIIPSGILRPHCRCLIGPGAVLNPSVLQSEIAALSSVGIDVSPSRMLIDRSTQIILPHHVVIDQNREIAKGKAKIGTTGRGIGPAYEDRAARCAIRLADLAYPEALKEKVRERIEHSNAYLRHVLRSDASLEFAQVWAEVEGYAAQLLPHIANGSSLLDAALRSGSRVVFEGAQGTLLDQVFGTVPFVTSSHTIAASVGTGCGLGPRAGDYVLGVAKAYCTRVGSGPFPTELLDELGDQIRKAGAEYGTVTGRPRRCGWFDVMALRYAVRVNGLNSVGLTKLDVLSGLETIRVAVGYRLHGRELDDVPALAAEYEEVEVLYRDFPGWSEDISGVTSWEDLPLAAKAYVASIEGLIGCPISLVSVGPDRKATLYREDAAYLKEFAGA